MPTDMDIKDKMCFNGPKNEENRRQIKDNQKRPFFGNIEYRARMKNIKELRLRTSLQI